MNPPSARDLVFPSKRDRWLFVVLGSSVVVMGGSIAASAVAGASSGEVAFGAAIALLSMGLILWILFVTRYVFEGNALLVRCGPFRWRIPYAAITAVESSGSLLSGPALSLERLAIRYGKRRTILVSPRDQAGFLETLRARVPSLSAPSRSPG